MPTRPRRSLPWAGTLLSALALGALAALPAQADPVTPAGGPAPTATPTPGLPTTAEPTLSAPRTAGLDPTGERITVIGAGFVPGPLALVTWASVTTPVAGAAPAAVETAAGRPTAGRQAVAGGRTVAVDQDGRFVATLPVARPADARPDATFELRAHPAGDPTRWTALPITFAAPRAGVTPTPSVSTPPMPTSSPAAAKPVLRSAAAASPRISVSRRTGLDPAGSQVTVTGSGYDVNKGIYVAFCVDKGAGQVPSPCVGGVDMDGGSGSSAWISSNPPPYGKDLAKPYGPGGTFQVRLTVKAKDQFTDCTKLACAVVTRNDHTRSSDRSQDVRVRVTFATGGAKPAAKASTTASPQVVRPAGGGSLPNTGTGPLVPIALTGLALLVAGAAARIGVRGRRVAR